MSLINIAYARRIIILAGERYYYGEMNDAANFGVPYRRSIRLKDSTTHFAWNSRVGTTPSHRSIGWAWRRRPVETRGSVGARRAVPAPTYVTSC
jgi:hypothetical protein